MSYSNILVVLRLHRKVSNCWQKRYLSPGSKGTHQFNYSRFRPGNVQSIAAPMLEDLRSVMQEETQSFLIS